MDLSNPQTFATFGSLLRVLRRQARLTQGEFGDRVGYSDAQINRYEKGVRVPDASVVAGRFVSALGLNHEPELAARLVELAQKPLPTEQTTANPTPPTPTGLPRIANAFFGRAADVDELKQVFAQTGTRLLTLVGPPGIGKTRLAIQLLTELEPADSQSALFVNLASVTRSDLIADAILKSLGVSSDSTNPQRQLEHVLQPKGMLILLDNFEQLLEESTAQKSADFVAHLLTTVPYLKFVVTSRASLRLSQEYVYDVPVLDANAAGALFINRAGAIHPSRKDHFQNDPAIADICRKLDFLPLAIELAAARSRLFDPANLLKRLSAGLCPI